MKVRIYLAVSILLFTLTSSGCTIPASNALVVRVIDGDTIVIEGGLRVRYIGIDTPELYPRPEPLAEEAWQANRRLVEDKIVRLERDTSETDKYGRLLRYVYAEGKFVNGELVKVGLARVKAYPPDTRYQELLEEIEAEAKSKGLGIWAR